MAAEYRGLFGAFVSALRSSDSLLLRAYVLASALVGAFVAVVLFLGLVTWLATPVPLGQRALLGVIGIAVLVPLFAPVLVVARRHRRGIEDRRADAALGLSGFGFVLAVYLALLISDPDPHSVSGPIAPLIDAVDALPRRYWFVPPALSAVSIGLTVRHTRPAAAGEGASGTGDDTASDGTSDIGDDTASDDISDTGADTGDEPSDRAED